MMLTSCGKTGNGGEAAELLMAVPGFKAPAAASKTRLREGHGYCDAMLVRKVCACEASKRQKFA